MSKIGYIRVSTEHQETARQQEIMCSYQVDRIFSEKLSGANTDRPQLRAMLDYVREGDTLYIESISRLGRSTKDLLNIIDTLTDKGVTLISHKEKIDTDTPAGKFMLTVFAALSQLEREQLKQRQREGIEIAKAQGKYTGRKPIPTDWTRFGQLYGEWRAKHITGRDFMRRMNMSANTFYRRVREYELRHGITEPTPTFSACFGQAFLELHPTKYAEELVKKMKMSGAKAYLVNTGWNGTGKRISIKDTRGIIDAILNGDINNVPTKKIPYFDFEVPTVLNGVDTGILDPRDTYADASQWEEKAKDLAGRFIKNFKKYEGNEHGKALVSAGPQL